jgi:hypothetical protein
MAGRKPMGLVPYASKVEPEVKATLEALAQVQGMKGGQRELINDMLAAYKIAKPDAYEKATQLMELIGTGEPEKNLAKQE